MDVACMMGRCAANYNWLPQTPSANTWRFINKLGKVHNEGMVLDHRLVHIVGSGVADVRVIRGADVRSDPLSVDES